MKRTEINRILRSGKDQEKMILYFDNMAYYNLYKTEEYLTPEESKELEDLYISLEYKQSKPTKNLRENYQAFMLFRDTMTVVKYALKASFFKMSHDVQQLMTLNTFTESINQLLHNLRSISTSEREEAIKLVYEAHKKRGVIITTNNKTDYLDVDFFSKYDRISESIKSISDYAIMSKEFYNILSAAVKKDLPLPTVKKYLKETITEIIKDYQSCNDLIKDYIKLIKGGGKDKKESVIYVLPNFEDIVVDPVTAEDIKAFKNSGR